MEKITFFTSNVQGLKDKTKSQTLLNFLWNEGRDFYLLQETHLSENEYLFIQNKWEGDVFFSPGAVRTRGTAILCRQRNIRTLFKGSDANGNYNYIAINLNQQIFLIISLYAASGSTTEAQNARAKLFKNLKLEMQSKNLDNISVVMGGDFNSTLSEIDTLRCIEVRVPLTIL